MAALESKPGEEKGEDESRATGSIQWSQRMVGATEPQEAVR